MSKLKTIIIDDEASAQENLCLLADRFLPNVSIVGVFDNLMDGVDFIKKNKIDLVFLDVDMPNYAGYEIVNFVDCESFEIIFVTAYDKYAVKAFELSATDYLLKPIDIDRLKQAVQKVERNYQLLNDSEEYQALNRGVNLSFKNKIKIFNKFIVPASIIAIEAEGAYSKIYFDDATDYLVSKSLGQFEKELSEFQFFFRTHKSWLVNLNQVESLNNGAYIIYLKNQIKAKVSRYKIQKFKALFS
ncbi:LytTR family DNA-binding domain-containing protein [Aureispira sp. CCB-QB1]|uniref:LytR/AlgR family response regulator transcription factor n=1 Tax=Aureispira sp. CCB-QB1 TaxID=1313421 RepID=UPI0006980D5C|nr:LytTR family DNA-binding domain-containing protein [Aureispira sp. CCB-QB1]